MIIIKNKEEINLMRESGKIACDTLNYLEKHIKVGITTKELDELANKYITSKNAKPSFLGYNGFPASICTSINEEVVHGIPGIRKLEEGDIISIDLGVYKDGYHSDTAKTYKVGKVSKEVENLLTQTNKALYEGIKVIKPGVRLNEVCKNIEKIAKTYNFGVIRELSGHGVGKDLHEDPYVPNYSNETNIILEEGMSLAIEPMFTLGSREIHIQDDEWTISTEDKSYCAHFEHTIAVSKEGYEILSGDEENV